MEATIAVLNDLVTHRVIEKYAIGGAVGAIFWVEPFDTVDLDVFVFLPASAQIVIAQDRQVREPSRSIVPRRSSILKNQPFSLVKRNKRWPCKGCGLLSSLGE